MIWVWINNNRMIIFGLNDSINKKKKKKEKTDCSAYISV